MNEPFVSSFVVLPEIVMSVEPEPDGLMMNPVALVKLFPPLFDQVPRFPELPDVA